MLCLSVYHVLFFNHEAKFNHDNGTEMVIFGVFYNVGSSIISDFQLLENGDF